jgi:hypothetical protein
MPSNNLYSTRLPYNSTLGDLVRDGPAPSDRPFGDIGKFNVNLFDMADQGSFDPTKQAFDYSTIPGEAKPFAGSPLSGVDQYFAQPGGLFSGLLGALGSAVGGVFGQDAARTGADIGATAGKVIEAPLAIGGALPLPGAIAQAFLPEDVKQQINDFGQGSLFQGTALSGAGLLAGTSSLGGLFGTATNTLGLLGRFIERTVAGAADSGNGPLLGFMGRDMPDAYKQMVANGKLTEDQALDRMVLDGAGYSDDMRLNILASVVLDPVNLLSLGTGLAIKAAGATVKVSEALNVAGKLTAAEDLTGALGELQAVSRAYKAEGAGTDIAVADLNSRARLAAAVREVSPATRTYGTNADAGLQLGRMERLGLGIYGPVQEDSILGNVARKTDTVINLGLNKLFGHETAPASAAAAYKHTSTASAHGFLSGLGMNTVEHLAQAAEQLMPGGRGIIEDAMAVGAANKRDEVMLDMQVSDGLKMNRVPVVEGSTPGSFLSPYDAVHSVLKKSPFQRGIGKHVELLTERDKPFLYADGATPAQVQADSYSKFAEMFNTNADAAARVLGPVDENLAQAIHAAYYYHKGTQLAQEVVPALKALPVGSLPKSLRGAGFVDRLTQVGARTLTNVRVAPIEAAVKAKDATALRDLVFRYKEFDNLTEKMGDAELIDYVDEWLKQNRGSLLTEVPLRDPVTNAPLPGLPEPLANWEANAADHGYGLALAPPEGLPGDALYRATRNKDGVLTSIRPWMPFNPERLQDVTLPNAWERIHGSYLRGIRQERINWTNRRRFVTEMATGSQRGGVDIPAPLGQRMFDAIMVRARESNVQPRGLSPSSITEAARSVLREKEFVGAMRGQSISDSQLLMGTLKAFQGDLAQVGVTQKITGAAKVRLPGAGRNMWGQISENLYPLMRFAVNPVFLGMELVEPYILGAMRGITVPLRKGSDEYQHAVVTHEAVERLLRSGLNPEGSQMEQAEKLSLMRSVSSFAKQKYGRQTPLGKWVDRIAPGDIQRRKSAAMAVQTQRTFGRMMKESMQSIMGPDEFKVFWRDMQEHAGSVDDGEVAMKWAMENIAFTDADGTRITDVNQLLNPANIGQRKRYTLEKTPGAMTYDDVAGTLDAAIKSRSVTRNDLPGLFEARTATENEARAVRGEAPITAGRFLHDELRSGRMTREDLGDLFDTLGLNNSTIPGIRSNADNLWLHATGMTHEELTKAWRAFTDPVRGKTAHETRVLRDVAVARNMELIHQRARTMGITDDEFVRMHWRAGGVVHEPALGPGVAPTVLSSTVLDPLYDQRHDWLNRVARGVQAEADTQVVPGGYGLLDHPMSLEAMRSADDGKYMYTTLGNIRANEWVEYARPDATDLDVYAYQAKTLADPTTNPWILSGGPPDARVYVRVPKAGAYFTEEPGSPGFIASDHYYITDHGDAKDFEILDGSGKWVKATDVLAGKGRGEIPIPPPEQVSLANNIGALQDEIVLTNGRAYPPALYSDDAKYMLTPEEAHISDLYEGNTYAEINTYLRGLPHAQGRLHSDSELQDMVDALDFATRRSMLPEARTLHRGVNVSRAKYEFHQPAADEIMHLQIGQEYSDPAFLSWSSDEHQANSFATRSGFAPYGESHEAVVFHFDAPPGMRHHQIGGWEYEHLLPREKKFTVKDKWIEDRGDPYGGDHMEIVHYQLAEHPGNETFMPGVKRITIEEAPLNEAVPVQIEAQAALDASELKSRAPIGDVKAEAEAQRQADRALAAQPVNNYRTPVPGLGYVGRRRTVGEAIEDFDQLSPPEIQAAIFGPSQLTQSVYKFIDVAGKTMMPVLAEFLAQKGRRGMQDFLDFMDIVYRRGDIEARMLPDPLIGLTPFETEMGKMLAKGNHLVPSEGRRGMSRQASDIYDVLMGNTTRRADGRATYLGPVAMNEDALRGAGFVTEADLQKIEALTGSRHGLVGDDMALAMDPNAVHENATVYYNHLARELSRQAYQGVVDWSAQDAAALSAQWQRKYGLGQEGALLTRDVIDDAETHIPVEIHPGPLTKRGRAMYQPLLELLAEPQNRRELMSFMHSQAQHDGLMLVDQLGTAVRSGFNRAAGLGIWGENVAQPIIPNALLASAEMARTAADLLAYSRDQEEVWAFIKNFDPAADIRALTPQISIKIGFGGQFDATTAETFAKAIGVEGLTMDRLPNGDTLIEHIDDGKKLIRDATGKVDDAQIDGIIRDAIEEAQRRDPSFVLPDFEWDVHYGDVYKAGPARLPGGKPDWKSYEDTVLANLQARGLDGWTGSRLSDIRAAAKQSVTDDLRSIAPQQFDRAYRNEPLVPHVLEDNRTGVVHGSTEFDADGRAVVRAFGAADPVTGLHELMHVFAKDLTGSQREVIMKAREDALLAHRTDTEARIAEFRAKADAAKSNTTKRKYRTQADALEAGLGEMVDENNFGVEHQEFFVSQAMRWFKTGTLDDNLVGNTELVASFEHFRNWINNIWGAVQGKRDPTSMVSPEMNGLFNSMFSGKPRVETAAYKQTDQALRMAAYQNLGAAFDEAFQTQQYKRDRGMLERSLNHPYIGLYPMSYMWGKVLPEMIAFLALNPFGMKTPLLGWNVGREISDTIRARSESDPAFAKWMTDNKEMFQLFSMIFPALPQEIPANVSLPVRRIAEQGLTAEMAARQGTKMNPIDWSKGASDAITYAVGPLGTLRMGTENIPGAINTMLFGSDKARKQAAQDAFKKAQSSSIDTSGIVAP